MTLTKQTSKTNFTCCPHQVLTPDEEPGGLTKTRSCDNLTIMAMTAQEGTSNLTRRSSDPNIGCGGDTMALLSKEVDGSQRRNSTDDAGSDDSCDSEGRPNGADVYEEHSAQQSPSEEEEKEEGVEEVVGNVCNGGTSEGQDRDGVPEPCGGDSEVGKDLGEHASSVSQPPVTEPVEQAPEAGGSQEEDTCSPSPTVNGEVGTPAEGEAVLTNGVDHSCVEVDTQTTESGLLNGNHYTSAPVNDVDDINTTPSTAIVDNRAIDSSTDTLTDAEEVDQAFLLKSRRRFFSEHSPAAFVAYQKGNGHFNPGDIEDTPLQGRRDLDAASVESLKLMIQKNCSISTSTTDISDSHVSANGASEVASRVTGLGLYIRCNNGMCGMGGVGHPTPSSSEASPSVCSLVATPINSHTPPSTCSPTPWSEGKVGVVPGLDCYLRPVVGKATEE